jgi:hypothetical protein
VSCWGGLLCVSRVVTLVLWMWAGSAGQQAGPSSRHQFSMPYQVLCALSVQLQQEQLTMHNLLH